MALNVQIENDLRTAMKAKEALRVAALRMAVAALKNRQIEKRGELTDEDAIGVLAKLVKQRHESIEMYKKGGRNDLAAKEEAEATLLQTYLPKQMSAAEVEKLVEGAIAQAHATGIKDLGAVMKIVSPQVKGRADGKMVSELVRQKLQ